MNQTLNLYTGIILSFCFSIFFMYLLVRSAISDNPINWKIISIVGGAMIFSVALVGNTPYIALFQNVIISLGSLFALYHHITKNKNANPRIVALLVAAMLVSLLINQASRSFKIGLLEWFTIEVNEKVIKTQLPHNDSKTTTISEVKTDSIASESEKPLNENKLGPESEKLKLISNENKEVINNEWQLLKLFGKTKNDTIYAKKSNDFLNKRTQATYIFDGGFFSDTYKLRFIDKEQGLQLEDFWLEDGKIEEFFVFENTYQILKVRFSVESKTKNYIVLRVYQPYIKHVGKNFDLKVAQYIANDTHTFTPDVQTVIEKLN